MNKKYCYFNGEVIDFSEVKISPNDLGFLRGYGVFDALRTFKGIPFLLNEHWERLLNSAKELNIEVPISKDEFLNIIDLLLKKNNLKDVSVRTILTGGITDNGISMKNGPTIMITVDDINIFVPSKEFFENGAKAITLEFKRFLPKAKTLNYIAAIKEQKRKEEMNAQEIVYVNNGTVLEGATSNVFIIKNGKIITANDNILMGTVRNFVIKLARENGLEVEERTVMIDELFEAEEFFITGTYKWVLPVVRVDDKPIGTGKVGEKTREIMEMVNSFIEKN